MAAYYVHLAVRLLALLAAGVWFPVYILPVSTPSLYLDRYWHRHYAARRRHFALQDGPTPSRPSQRGPRAQQDLEGDP